MHGICWSWISPAQVTASGGKICSSNANGGCKRSPMCSLVFNEPQRLFRVYYLFIHGTLIYSMQHCTVEKYNQHGVVTYGNRYSKTNIVTLLMRTFRRDREVTAYFRLPSWNGSVPASNVIKQTLSHVFSGPLLARVQQQNMVTLKAMHTVIRLTRQQSKLVFHGWMIS